MERIVREFISNFVVYYSKDLKRKPFAEECYILIVISSNRRHFQLCIYTYTQIFLSTSSFIKHPISTKFIAIIRRNDEKRGEFPRFTKFISGPLTLTHSQYILT